ncbi:MAG: flagellar M-ring protein FliF [Nocardioides sp.]|nr:flagellar M-ring protein FliF [Nocardioides sp.]
MRDDIQRTLSGYRETFTQFTVGQKVVALVGSAALLLGGFMVFQWASAPAYSPLFSHLSSSDAAAVIEELDASGTPYEITDGGGTIMVPRDAVYQTRIELSGQGLPASSEGGYSLLDDQGISTSEFQEQTDFKRAMEGELASTIEAIDGVNGAVVHLAMPAKDVFADEQQPPTASVLVQTSPGRTLTPEQVQAVVHLVASSIDGLDPDDVTVADSSGKVLSAPGGTEGADAAARTSQVEAVQDQARTRLQAMLDRVVGVGNSTVQVTADLDFASSVTETTDYRADEEVPELSSSTSSEVYAGAAADNQTAGGVVGTDGQAEGDATGGSDSSYRATQKTVDNGVDTVRETRETSPGDVQSWHVGVVLDSNKTGAINPRDVRDLVADAMGIQGQGPDTIRVVQLPFDRTAEEAAAAELEAAAAGAADAGREDLIRNIALGAGVLLILLLALLKGRRRAKQRAQATTLVVEQLRQDRQAIEAPATQALLEVEAAEESTVQQELSQLIEKQPEDVASLLRGWLVER